ncbi:MAG TPA: hypothetical protein PLE82_04835 [Saccharofermentans sp.]|nr:hypothetical protein [Saccharofermentans sp.]
MALDNENKTPEELAAELEAARKAEEAANRNKSVLSDPDIAALVQQQLDEKLRDIKQKLDSAYSERDEALRKTQDANEALKQANLKRLEEEGKHKEALEIRLADEQAVNAALKKHNVELTRDNAVRNELRALEFRNQNAYDMAFRSLVDSLTLDTASNTWSQAGVSIREAVKDFAANPEQQFLFKPKANSGGGQGDITDKPADTSNKNKSLFSRTQAEVLAMAEKGLLNRKN